MARRPTTFVQRMRDAGMLRTRRTVRSDSESQRRADRMRSSARWQRLRASVLRREPCCRMCKAQGITEYAATVDHIVPVQQRPDLTFVRSNLQPLCTPCHGNKSAMERRSR